MRNMNMCVSTITKQANQQASRHAKAPTFERRSIYTNKSWFIFANVSESNQVARERERVKEYHFIKIDSQRRPSGDTANEQQ